MSHDDASCLFCRIAGGEIETEFVYADEHVVAFRDINPQAPVHVLVIPRRHIVEFTDLPQVESAEVGEILQGVARAAASVGAPGGYRVVANRGRDAGQTVFHLHFHVIPVWEGVALGRHGHGMADAAALRDLADLIAAQLR